LTGEYSEIPYTTFKYYTKGIRDYNTVLMALIHEEKYLNVINEALIDNDLLFDRGVVNVNERHLRMSEIDTVEQLIRYNQNFFNVKKF
jgi:tRNA splicing endonuclease